MATRKRYIPVDSSWIQGIKQEKRGKKYVTRMRTHSGGVYDYRGSKVEFDRWVRAGSKGRYFNQFKREDLIRRVY